MSFVKESVRWVLRKVQVFKHIPFVNNNDDELQAGKEQVNTGDECKSLDSCCTLFLKGSQCLKGSISDFLMRNPDNNSNSCYGFILSLGCILIITIYSNAMKLSVHYLTINSNEKNALKLFLIF